MEKRITNTPTEISDDSEITEPEEYIDEDTDYDDPEEDQDYDHSSVGDNIAEAILAFVAYAILILGILATVIVGGFFLFDDYKWYNLIGWIILFTGIPATLLTWASMMILINISNNVRQIKHELQNRRH